VSSDDTGFTLVELLVVVAVVGVIGPVLAAAISMGLRVTTATTAELAASHNRQYEAAYFTSDVQSAVTIEDETSTDVTTCMSAGQTLVGRLSWTDISFNGTSTSRAVSYATATVSGDRQLVRNTCTGGAMLSVPLVHGAVSSNLDCASVTFATVACSTAAGAVLTTSDVAGSWVLKGLVR
jgi:prepilin-type N-terminal cleavage/methylation domain-containing protein